ncbi:MAG: hypothetical protein WDO19_31180 [Bacteroidota bacterium]
MKRYLLGIAALIMAIGFTAFTTKKADTSGKSHFQTPTWVLIDQGQASDATYRAQKPIILRLQILVVLQVMYKYVK